MSSTQEVLALFSWGRMERGASPLWAQRADVSCDSRDAAERHVDQELGLWSPSWRGLVLEQLPPRNAQGQSWLWHQKRQAFFKLEDIGKSLRDCGKGLGWSTGVGKLILVQ